MAKGLKNKVVRRFNSMLMYSFIVAGMTLLLGLALLIVPSDISNKMVGIFAGCVFIVSGISSIFKYLHRDGAKLYSLNLAFGIIYGLLGLFIILFPFTIVSFVTISLGIYLVISGALKLNYAFWLKKGNEDSWSITVASGIMLIIFGILVMFNPFVKLALPKLTGAFLLVSAALDITDTVLFKKRAKEIMEIFW